MCVCVEGCYTSSRYKTFCTFQDTILVEHVTRNEHVENVVSLFSSPSTSSQKVRKRGSHNFLSQAIEQNQFDHYTHPCVPTVYAHEFLVALIWCL